MRGDIIHWFNGMGFRPSVPAPFRDQYGDRTLLVLGDDRPVEGKVPSELNHYDPVLDRYHHLGGTPVSSVSVSVPVEGPSVPEVPSVDLAGAREFMAVTIVVLLIGWCCLKFASVDEECRGTSDGCSGHV
ncbi:hypothetical protein JJJ17_02655 [Paracoccus caeni]|uniref:Uncharacterized protein n=1 Tax=Paracoccus caeni TaxID=657651 RepID=A0A934S9V1_9RHOB|nr:hypothetical protein [Paracoccus caeni]MBK4214821.1 hypothetical protein [Paracoccus caeni]